MKTGQKTNIQNVNFIFCADLLLFLSYFHGFISTNQAWCMHHELLRMPDNHIIIDLVYSRAKNALLAHSIKEDRLPFRAAEKVFFQLLESMIRS